MKLNKKELEDLSIKINTHDIKTRKKWPNGMNPNTRVVPIKKTKREQNKLRRLIDEEYGSEFDENYDY